MPICIGMTSSANRRVRNNVVWYYIITITNHLYPPLNSGRRFAANAETAS